MKNIAYKLTLHKVGLIVVFGVVFTTSLFIPQTVEAKDNFVSSALKGIANIFSFNTDENVEEVIETQSVFPDVEDRKPTRVLAMVMTAYSSEAAQTDATPCIPADWKYNLCEHYEQNGEQDTIAANFLPLGTKVRFPHLYGDKVFTVRDRMNARYSTGRGDIWMPSKNEAKQFGVKRVTMEIFSK
jgi:3D (Asp-Asp-Asp) domain-containing protein